MNQAIQDQDVITVDSLSYPSIVRTTSNIIAININAYLVNCRCVLKTKQKLE